MRAPTPLRSRFGNGNLVGELPQLRVQGIWLSGGEALDRPLHIAALGHRYRKAQADGRNLQRDGSDAGRNRVDLNSGSTGF